MKYLLSCLNRFNIPLFLFITVMGAWSFSPIDVSCGRASGQKLVLGMSAPLSGPSQYLGLDYYRGIARRVQEQNCNSRSKKLGILWELKIYDDSYIPEVTLENVQRLIFQDSAIALVGLVGTPTTQSVLSLVDSTQIPLFGVYSGANLFRRNPPQSFVFNFRASYQQEVNLIISHIVSQGIPFDQVGFFVQDDSYGDAGLKAAQAKMEKMGCAQCLNQELVFKYQRNTLELKETIRQYYATELPLRAVVIVGASRASAKFMKYSLPYHANTLFYNLSFVGASELAKEIKIPSSRVFITQVVHGSQEDMNEVNAEGYLAMEAFFKSLQSVKGRFNSKAIREALHQQYPQHNILNCTWLDQMDHQGSWKTIEKECISE